MQTTFHPQPGYLAVVREKFTVKSEAGLIAPEDVQDAKSKVNPWALVVGVGTNPYPDKPFDVKAGDKVLISEIGRHVELTTADGTVDWIYVLAFQGVMGKLGWKCEKCKSEYTTEPQGPCPNCPRISTTGTGSVWNIQA